jgi:hypothetical protein
MFYAALHMNDDRTTFDHRAIVPEAAEISGISPEAAHARLSRGTLKREKGEDGMTCVLLQDDRKQPNGDRTDGMMPSNSLAFQLVQDEIAFLRRELERKDYLLAAALERIPDPLSSHHRTRQQSRENRLRRSRKTREGKSVGEEQEKKRSWWRRFFGS